MKIRQSIYEYENELKEIRRYLHKNPEISFDEYSTKDFIVEYLNKLKPNLVEVVGDTGVKCVFLGENPQKTIAIRADIDALPILERNICEYTSKNKGVMHGCGHDGHMAIALVCAKIISKSIHKNNVVFIFQPGEETDGGAENLIKQGVLKNPDVDEIYALHLWPYLQGGKVGLKSGELMAAMCDLNIEIMGKSAHGARPNQGLDAIVAAANIISSVQSIISRNVDPLKTAVITIGKISGGEARNVVCENVLLEGTIRTFEEEILEFIKNKLISMLKGLEIMYNVSTRYFETMTFPAVNNSEKLHEKVDKLFGKDEKCLGEAVMLSEDFSYYQKEVLGFYAYLGIKDDSHNESLHSNKFDFDEKYLMDGVEYFLRIVDNE